MVADNKFDLGGLVGNIKSIINPAGGTPDADPNDVLGVQIAELSELVQGLKKKHDDYSKDMSSTLAKINQLYNGVHKSLQAIHAAGEAASDDGVDLSSAADVSAKADSEPEIEVDSADVTVKKKDETDSQV